MRWVKIFYILFIALVAIVTAPIILLGLVSEAFNDEDENYYHRYL